MALARVGVIGQQDVADPFSHVFLVFFSGDPGLGGKRGEHVVEPLAGPFVEAEPHHARLSGLRVHVEHVFHIGQVFTRQGADAPHFFPPGLELTLFKTLRIVSFETAGP